MTSSRKFERLLQAGCLGLIGMLAAAGCGGSSSPSKGDTGVPDSSAAAEGGVLPAAVLTVNPPTVDLGTIDVGVKSTPVAVTVTNAGKVASGPLTVTVSGTGIIATGCSGAPLAPNATCTISVTGQLAVPGTISGTIEVGDATTTKKIAVAGLVVQPGQFSLSATALDLGNVLQGKTASGSVTVSAQAVLDGMVITVGGAGFADAKTGDCTGVLSPSKPCTVNVTFTAGTTTGPAKGTLTVSQGGVTRTVALTANVQSPTKLVMTPTSASLQTVFGTPSSPVTFIVTNAGDVTSTIPAVTITGTNKDDFSLVSTCGTALTGGAIASCTVTVTYNPKTVPTTNSQATLTVAETAPGTSTVSAPLVGTAVKRSDLVITGATTDFGTVVTGATSTALTFTVTNQGGVNSGLIKVSVGSPFAIVATADTCTDKTLDAKATCLFTAVFKPVAGDSGVIQGTLKAVGANVEEPGTKGVTGNAVPQAGLAINPKSLEFGSLPTYQESPPQTLTISNTGAAPTGALKVENTGAQFKIKGDTCTGAVLTATGATKTCTITVTFTSTGTDVEATGSIVVSDTTGAAGTVSATLHGTGTKHAALELSPSVVCPQYASDDPLCNPNAGVDSRFVDMLVGQTTAEMTFTLKNNTLPTDAPDSGELTFTVTGDAAADFKIVKNNCTAPLISTGGTATSCVLTLTFTPSSLGLRKALLQLTTSRGGAAQATLEGKGLPVMEVQPLNISKIHTGLDFGQVPLGQDDPNENSLAYRVWVRDTNAADRNTTVTVALPTPNPANFVYPTANGSIAYTDVDDLLTPSIVPEGSLAVARATNPCDNKTLSLAMGIDKKLTPAAKAANSSLGYTCDDHGYCYCDFAVQFYPQSARGPLTADLTASGTGGGTGKLTLTGTASGPLTIKPSPATLREPVAVGTSSSTLLTLTIKNESAVADMTNLSFALSGTGAADFQIVWTSCWGQEPLSTPSAGSYARIPAVTLAHQTSCVVFLGFEPKTEGQYSVTFTATAANGAGAADDEVANATLIATGSKVFGPLTITQATPFADTPYKMTGAQAVTFTIKNNGTLDAKNFHYDISGEFTRFASAGGGAGTCSESDSFVLAGGSSCTIQVIPTPTGDPDSERKKQVGGTLSVTSTAGGLTYSVEARLAYYETSDIMIVEGDKTVPVSAYSFAPAYLNAKPTQSFVVKNIGSAPVGLDWAFQNYGGVVPTAFNIVSRSGLSPAQCEEGANTMDPGESCTIVVESQNSAEGVIPPEKPVTLVISDPSNAKNLAKIKLSSATGGAAHLVTWGLPAPEGVGALEVTASLIELGTVPFSNGSTTFRGGVATVSLKNIGSSPTQPLTFRWNTRVNLGAVVQTTVANTTQDPEFNIRNFGEDLTKALQPGEVRDVQIQFSPAAVRVDAGDRYALLEVIESGAAPVPFAVFHAVATLTQSPHVIDDANTPNVGFVQFSRPTPQNGATVDPEIKVVTVKNGDAVERTLVLSITGGEFDFASSQPAAQACDRTAAGNTLGSGGSCKVALVFKPTAAGSDNGGDAISRFAKGELHVDGGSVTAVLGLLGRMQVPVTLSIRRSSAAAGCTASLGELTGAEVAQLDAEGKDCVDFGAVGVGASKQQVLTVTNIGDVKMEDADPGLVASVRTTSVLSGASWTITSDQCNGLKLAANGGSCTITVSARGAERTTPDNAESLVTVKPATGDKVAPKSYSVQVEVMSAADLKVEGSGIFENTPVTGYNTAERAFLIYNGTDGLGVGELPVNVPTGVVSVTLGGTNADQFTIYSNNLSPNLGIEGGETHRTVIVRFTPTKLTTAGSSFTATLNVFDANVSATEPVKKVVLQGTSISELAIDPPGSGTELPRTLAMGSVLQTLTVSKLSTALATAPLKTAIDNKEFILVDDWCYGKILSESAEGISSCKITVKYIGLDTSTAKTATLTVDGGGAGKDVAIKLSYTGAAATGH